MASYLIFLLAALVVSLLLDRTVRPYRLGRLPWQALALHALAITGVYGLFFACSGDPTVAALLTTALMALLTITSNAKYAMLGEPLLFSDLALIAALVRHPRFYFTAISIRQRCIAGLLIPILLLVLAALFVPRWAPHLMGLALFAGSAAALSFLFRMPAIAMLAPVPDVDADLELHGLIATLLLYWKRWRQTADPPPFPPLPRRSGEPVSSEVEPAPHFVVVVQCESFADPVELTARPEDLLAGLTRARASSWQWGRLNVSGFGAYTMRTEYGVLFGRSEQELGFRRYDPFLTAHGETSYALPRRLRRYGYQCLFVHPHDMRFYGRDRLMPAIGFDRLLGEESFVPVSPGSGRYVDDVTVGHALGDLIDAAAGPTLIYAVTMENHGPWDMNKMAGPASRKAAYLRHLRSSDAMLTGLIERLSDAGQPALLVFFGDHRPSIPGATEPGGERHTPYVMLRFSGDGRIMTGANRRIDLAPDELHHEILRCIVSGGDVTHDPTVAADLSAI